MKNKTVLFLGVLGFIHLILLSRQQFTLWPEIFSFPYLFNRSFNLYSDFVIPYPPLLTLILSALFKVFGYSTVFVKIFTYGLILVNDFLVFNIVSAYSKKNSRAYLSLIFYIGVQSFLDGNMLWFDSAIVTPILFAIYFSQKKKYWHLSVSLLIACLIKQTAGIYLIIFLIYFAIKMRNELTKLLSVAIFGTLLLSIFLLTTHSFTSFLNWNLVYPIAFWSKFPGYVQFHLTNREYLTVLILSIPALVALIKRRFLIFALYIGSLISIYPRFSYFHMQTAIALSAVSLYYFMNFKSKFATLFIFASIVYISKPIISLPVNNTTRFFEDKDLMLATKINANTNYSTSLFLLGIPSSVYVLTNTIPPKPWLDNYGWYYEMPGESITVLESFAKSKPEYIVRREPEVGSWYDLGTYEPKALLSWILDNYDVKENLGSNIYLWKRKN